jgi:uncharacterized membrane protein
MDDQIRVSDADRDRVTARLREHFAEGRLTQDELDERISAALSAKTFGDLRPVMADLPEPAPAPLQAGPSPQWGGRPWIARRRGPRVLPVLLLVLLASVLISGGGGWLLFAFFRLMLVFWLVTLVTGIFAAGRFRRRLRRGGYPGSPRQWWI